MPRKTLDRSRSVLGCFAKRQQTSPWGHVVLALLCLLQHTPQRLMSRVPWNKCRFCLYCNYQSYSLFSHFKAVLNVHRNNSFFVANRKALAFAKTIYGVVKVDMYCIFKYHYLFYKVIYKH